MTLQADEMAALAPLDTMADTMLDQVRAWAGINSGSRNLAGLAMIADGVKRVRNINTVWVRGQ
jgi:hypothetical protein